MGLHCVNASTGKGIYFDQSFEFGSLIGISDKMIMLIENRELVWGDLADTKFKETYCKKILEGLCRAVPVMVKGHLNARNAEGGLVCLKLK